MPPTNEILPIGENHIYESFVTTLSIKSLAISVSMFSIMPLYSPLIIFHLFLPLCPILNRHAYCRLSTHVFILIYPYFFKFLRQLDIQHHGFYQVQILLAEPWKIDTSEINMALFQ